MERVVDLNETRVCELLDLPTEEAQHAWRHGIQHLDRPLLRIWDCKSGSQPQFAQGNRMEARSPRQALITKDARRNSLAIHANHKNWTATPYISFKTSPMLIENYAGVRSTRHRGSQNLIVVNPAVRVRKGLPILDMGAEMRHYGVKNPYRKGNAYFVDHYLCPWEVTAEEVVGCWSWMELIANANWYEEVVMPAYREHAERHLPNMKIEDLSSMFCGLAGKSSRK